MEVIPSDLVRLIGDIMSRSDSPMKIERCLEPDTEFENCLRRVQLVFELTWMG